MERAENVRSGEAASGEGKAEDRLEKRLSMEQSLRKWRVECVGLEKEGTASSSDIGEKKATVVRTVIFWVKGRRTCLRAWLISVEWSRVHRGEGAGEAEGRERHEGAGPG